MRKVDREIHIGLTKDTRPYTIDSKRRCALRPSLGKRIVSPSLCGVLLLVWLSGGIAVTGGQRIAHAQTIPQIIGSYQGTGTDTITVSADGEVVMTIGPLPSQSVMQIDFQQGGSFTGTGSLDIFGFETPGGGEIITGSVDANGNVSGSFTFLGTGNVNGTFTGQISDGQAQITYMGTVSVPNETATEVATESGTATMMKSSSTAKSDLSLATTVSSTKVASGDQISYSMRVTNEGPDEADGVALSFPALVGTTVSSGTSSQGTIENANPGSTGDVVFLMGPLANGASATASLTLNVLAAGGTTITATPSVMSLSSDPNLNNNMAMLSTAVAGGAVIELVWDQPAPTAANPTPAPENLRATVVRRPTAALDRRIQDDSCTLVDINIYKSDQPDVQPIPANLWETVPPDMEEATMAAAPTGSFYVITNVWNCGGTVIESSPSNETSTPAGPTINKLKVGAAKLKAIGAGFNGPVQVLVDGVAFVKSAVVQSGGTVVQKGALADGSLIKDIGATNQALITVVNQDGGVGTFAYKKP